MSEQELAVIKERAFNATDGPWSINQGDLRSDSADEQLCGLRVAWIEPETISESDVDFIMHAREDIPKLITEVEYLRETLQIITNHRVNHFITKDKMVESMFNVAKGALNDERK